MLKKGKDAVEYSPEHRVFTSSYISGVEYPKARARQEKAPAVLLPGIYSDTVSGFARRNGLTGERLQRGASAGWADQLLLAKALKLIRTSQSPLMPILSLHSLLNVGRWNLGCC